MSPIEDRFGRRYALDPRDADYGIQLCTPRTGLANRRYWYDNAWRGDQGWLPHCVGFAWTGWLEAGPVRHIGRTPIIDPSHVYYEAQKVDEWPGEGYAGTSVRAGAKILRRLGFIKSYHWARNLNDIVKALIAYGPVVVGTAWYEGMDQPRPNGIVRARGKMLGGHAYLLTGVNRRKRLLRITNSYGRQWGRQGRAYIPFIDMARLLRMQGEACLALEKSRGD
jgi:hypothetical protein